jgi:hypothetical protein
MAIVHEDDVRDGMADTVVDAIDVGTADANGDLEIAVLADFVTVLSTIQLANPAFGAGGAVVTGRADANGLPLEDASAVGGGNAGVFRTRSRDNTEIFRGTVTATGGGGDMQLSSIAIANGDAVRLNTFTYTSPP